MQETVGELANKISGSLNPANDGYNCDDAWQLDVLWIRAKTLHITSLPSAYWHAQVVYKDKLVQHNSAV